MDASEYNFYYEPYRRVPMNSATTQQNSSDCNSIGTYSTYSIWPRSIKRAMPTTYVDATTIFGQYDRSCSMKDLFPKGKGRQKSLNLSEKKNAHDAYMSLLPTDASTVRSERTFLSTSTATKSSNLPEVSPKSANIRNKRLSRAAVFDDNSESKFYARYATTHVNSAWIRRYKSINESQILSDVLRDQSYRDKVSLKKRPYQQLFVSSSSSSLIKRRRDKC